MSSHSGEGSVKNFRKASVPYVPEAGVLVT
jgi:hypothetical protein